MTAEHAPSAVPLIHYRTVDGTTWPVNLTGDDEHYGLENQLRYSPEQLTRTDQLVLASVVAAYVHLTDPNRTQEEARRSLRRARTATHEARNV